METSSPAPLNLLERFNRWIQESVMVKLFSIGFLLLILLIPTAWIQSLMEERQSRANTVMTEVSDKWSGSQTVSGPILVIPYKKHEIIDRGKDGTEIREHIEKAYFLPEELDINGKVSPQILHRGIFDAVVYQSTLGIRAAFPKPDFKILSIDEKDVIWSEAKLVFGITDLRGISENPVLTIGDKNLTAEPLNNIGVSVLSHSKESFTEEYTYASTSGEESTTGIESRLNWENAESFQGNVAINLALKGSRRLDFIPAGKTTSVKISGPWNDPSFVGEFLPTTREITESSFNATWKVLHFNRPFAQQWAAENQQLSGADFGVKLLIPVDQYQKSIRTAKYAILMILLTFVALLLVEITQKIRIHPFQYILIGAALIIYYTLLLSFSEHMGYDAAYLIASISTVILIGLYSSTFLKKKSLIVLFSLLLSVFYTFIFVIILQQDFSLLLGSIGLFIIIGLLMFFSRKVKWYEEVESSKFKV
jgi:inner membrane protein